jgi:hypothetical protein
VQNFMADENKLKDYFFLNKGQLFILLLGLFELIETYIVLIHQIVDKMFKLQFSAELILLFLNDAAILALQPFLVNSFLALDRSAFFAIQQKQEHILVMIHFYVFVAIPQDEISDVRDRCFLVLLRGVSVRFEFFRMEDRVEKVLKLAIEFIQREIHYLEMVQVDNNPILVFYDTLHIFNYLLFLLHYLFLRLFQIVQVAQTFSSVFIALVYSVEESRQIENEVPDSVALTKTNYLLGLIIDQVYLLDPDIVIQVV